MRLKEHLAAMVALRGLRSAPDALTQTAAAVLTTVSAASIL